jgi:hypothetical protein
MTEHQVIQSKLIQAITTIISEESWEGVIPLKKEVWEIAKELEVSKDLQQIIKEADYDQVQTIYGAILLAKEMFSEAFYS